MGIKSNQAIKPKSLGSVAKNNAFKGAIESANVAGNTTGIKPLRLQGIMEGVDGALIDGDIERLKQVVRRSSNKPDTLQRIDPLPLVRHSNAKAFAENT